jgi:hypothetical protein
MGIEQGIGELANLQDGWTFMPQLDFFSQRIPFYQPNPPLSLIVH